MKAEIQTFADVNVTWLSKLLTIAKGGDAKVNEAHARAIFAAVSGAQLLARSRADIDLFDSLVDSYRDTGLLPR